MMDDDEDGEDSEPEVVEVDASAHDDSLKASSVMRWRGWRAGGQCSELHTSSALMSAINPSTPLQVENLGLCEQTVAALHARGIQRLFPIQKSVFVPIAEGRDLIGRAKTGSGKTLAFALPVVEACLKVPA